MKEKWSKLVTAVKDFWGKLGKTAKILLIVAVAVVIAAIIVTVIIRNNAKSNYVVLYPDLAQAEATQVYAEVKEQGVEPELDRSGQVLVPREQYEGLLMKLAEKGYPKSSQLFDESTFLQDTSFTQTEMEKKQLILHEKQVRLQNTIRTIEGVETCVVTLNLPEKNNRVWETQKEEAGASVTIGMLEGYELSPERVTGIRNLIASSVEKLTPENVIVIDALTGIDMTDEELNKATSSGVDLTRLEGERQIERQIESKIRTLLSPMFGEKVTATATVRLNYDVVRKEEQEYVPGDDGNGVKSHMNEEFDVGGRTAVGDIVGEENNTDTPSYANLTDDGLGSDVTHYERSIDWNISKRIVQTETGMGYIEEASAAVLVEAEEGTFTAEMQERLINIVSKGVNIPVDSISVEYYPAPVAEVISPEPDVERQTFIQFFLANWLLFAIAGGVLLLLIIALIIVLLIRRRAKKKVQEVQEEAEDLVRSAQAEIDEHKRALAEAAQANSEKENAIANEVREFAKQNPEITASLIRSLLKEDE